MARFWFQRVRRNAIHRAGGNPPPCFAGPLPGGDTTARPHPLLGGVAEGRGGSGRSRLTTRFLACRRAAVALESCIAATVLVAVLVGVYEVVHATLVRDFVARGAYRVANAGALYPSRAGGMEEMKRRCLAALKAELGDLLDFELAGANGECAGHAEDGAEPKSWCLAFSMEVYDNPTALKNGNKQNGAWDGGTSDLVVVRLTLKPQGLILGPIYTATFGRDGLRATAVVRNEREGEEV